MKETASKDIGAHMQLYLTGRQMELTDALRDHVERHLRQPVEAHGSVKPTRMEVQLYRTGDSEVRYGCHVLLELTHRHDINIREEDHDLYAAIDLAEKRLVRALVEYRDRQLTEGRRARKYTFDRLARALGWSSRRSER
jgi:ribosomal subunit interface protein